MKVYALKRKVDGEYVSVSNSGIIFYKREWYPKKIAENYPNYFKLATLEVKEIKEV